MRHRFSKALQLIARWIARRGANLASAFGYLLAHPVLGGLGSIAGLIGLYFVFYPIPAPEPAPEPVPESESVPEPGPPPAPIIQCARIETDYSVDSPENDDFGEVLERFDADLKNTIDGCDGHPYGPAISRLIEHFLRERTQFVENHTEDILDRAVPMREESSSQYRYQFRVHCPDGMEILEGSARIRYSSPPGGECVHSDLEANTFAEATVSQTEDEYKAGVFYCELSAKCKYSDETVRSLLSQQSLEIRDRAEPHYEALDVGSD